MVRGRGTLWCASEGCLSIWERKSSAPPVHASKETRSTTGGHGRDSEPWAAAYNRLGNRAFTQLLAGPQRLSDIVPRGGRPLPSAVREEFEPRLGADFGSVRVHDGAEAGAMAKLVDARAYTVGRDVVFGAGGFAPETSDGRRLLAHELTHVAQQGGAPAGSQPLAVSRPGDASERHADAVAGSATDPYRPFRDAWRPTPAAQGTAPARVAPMLARAPLGSNTYGAWDISETPIPYDSLKDGLYHYNVAITFSPNKATVNSTNIDFIQAAKLVDSAGKNQVSQFQKRLTADNWAIDQMAGAKSPWWEDPKGMLFTPPGAKKGVVLVDPGSSPSPLRNAVFRDWPGWNGANTSWSFETAAIARAGKDTGQVYGSVTWGFEVDASRNMTAHKAALTTPGTAFKGAATAWDTQATGPAADRSAPDQIKMPVLKY